MSIVHIYVIFLSSKEFWLWEGVSQIILMYVMYSYRNHFFQFQIFSKSKDEVALIVFGTAGLLLVLLQHHEINSILTEFQP